jgi:hypothetical protein
MLLISVGVEPKKGKHGRLKNGMKNFDYVFKLRAGQSAAFLSLTGGNGVQYFLHFLRLPRMYTRKKSMGKDKNPFYFEV